MDLSSQKLGEIGLECIEAEWDQHDRILRLFVDDLNSTEASGISLDRCVEATRQLDDWGPLDQAINGTYTLEVSSPGIERPLRVEKHFRKFIGSTVEISLNTKVCDRFKTSGKLIDLQERVDAENQGAASLVIETSKGVVDVPMALIKKAHLVFDWHQCKI